jgi:thiamine monophosphate synthase
MIKVSDRINSGFGGIDHTNVGNMVAAVALGVAAVRSIMQANNPAGAIRQELLAKFPQESLKS